VKNPFRLQDPVFRFRLTHKTVSSKLSAPKKRILVALKRCYEAVPALQAKAPLTISRSLSCLHFKVWDEKLQKMIGFPR